MDRMDDINIDCHYDSGEEQMVLFLDVKHSRMDEIAKRTEFQQYTCWRHLKVEFDLARI